MPHSYLAFIDESGDDGFKRFREPGENGGSSNWLVISALIFRQSRSLDAVGWRDSILRKMPDRKKREIHFKDLNHGQRVVASQELAKMPVKCISVLAAKKPIPIGVYEEKNQLYFYMTRYLIERISWLCRDMRNKVREGDGRVGITFSRRGGMSYPAFRDYLRKLQETDDGSVKVHWPVIDIEAVKALDHSRNASLQLADIVASSFATSFERDRYGNCEARYAELLKPITYSRNGNYLSYGVKIVPKPEAIALDIQQSKALSIWK